MSSRNKLITRTLIISLIINLIGIAYIAIHVMSYRSKVGNNFKSYTVDYHQRRKGHFETLPNHKGEVIFLGNSITDAGKWAELFQNPQFKNRGIAGDKTSDILNRLQEVLESEPAQLFMMAGINDISQEVTNDDILKNYEEIFKEIAVKSPYTEVFVQSVLPVGKEKGFHMNESVKDLNQRLEALCARQKVAYINLYESMGKDGALNPEYSNDGLHLNGKGYQQWKKNIQEYVKKPRKQGNKSNLRKPSEDPAGAERDKKENKEAKPTPKI